MITENENKVFHALLNAAALFILGAFLPNVMRIILSVMAAPFVLSAVYFSILDISSSEDPEMYADRDGGGAY